MAELTIKLKAPTDQRWSGTLPVEVRNINKSVLQARGFSDGTFEVPAGRYLVTATLPDGQQAGADEIIEVGQSDSKQVVLSLEGVELPSPLQSTAPWTDPLKALATPIANWFRPRPVALLYGVPLGTLLRLDSGPAPLSRTAVARTTIELKFADGAALLEIGTKEDCCYFAVPIDEDGKTTVQWDFDPATQAPTARFDFNGPVTAFYEYIAGGFAPQAKTLSRSVVKQAERYLMKEDGSRLRAALAAYVLLRANELDELDIWTAALYQHCKWLPDARAIRMEYLARIGRHQEAAALLLELPTCGVPWFRSGIVYAAARAKYYDALLTTAEDDVAGERASARAALARIAQPLVNLAETLDLSATTTVLRGLPRLA
jgi:hypothetical protein